MNRLLDAAIARAQGAIFSQQLANGAWEARSDLGPTSTANVIVAMARVGAATPDEIARATSWLVSRQRADGSFLPYPLADRGEVSATAQCWAALSLAEDPASREAAERAARFVDSQGGVDTVVRSMASGDLAAVYLAIARLVGAERLPCLPLAWCRSETVVRWLASRYHFGIIMGALELGMLVRALRSRPLLERSDATARAAVGWLLLYQNPDGSWNGNTMQTALALLGLHAAGRSLGDASLRRATAWLRSRAVGDPDGLWFDAFAADVWTTAFHLRALLLAGASRKDDRVVAALRWLLSLQLDVPQPWPNHRVPGALRTGGWPFQSGNVTMADTDDTGVVLSTLALALAPGHDGHRVDGAIAAEIRERSRRAVAWLRGMQNADGGWGAFVHALPSERRTALFARPLNMGLTNPLHAVQSLFVPPPELGDPSTEDLTARVLHGLACAGCKRDDPAVRDALRFARRWQTHAGGWWGRWQTNYLPATAYTIAGATRAGVSVDEHWIRRAFEFLLDRQNPDGGWGESPVSYRDPALAGRGESSPPMTGLVAAALLETCPAERAFVDRAVERATEYLLSTQQEDGGWPNGSYVVTNIPPDTFYTYAGAALHLPLEALARRRARAAGATEGFVPVATS